MRDFTGQRIGRLTVIRFMAMTASGHSRWECICDCGTKKTMLSKGLIAGKYISCGCWLAESAAKRAITHGQTIGGPTRAYDAWMGMKRRVDYCKDTSYQRYGGRGIKISEELRNFEAFFQLLGPCPEGLTLDRIDVNGHYERGNVRWATRKEQSRNRRNTKFLTAFGRRQPLTAWADELNIPRKRIEQRLKYGRSIEDALSKVPLH